MHVATVEELLEPHFRQIANAMGYQYRNMPFTVETRDLFHRGKYMTLENLFRNYLTGDLYHEYSLG